MTLLAVIVGGCGFGTYNDTGAPQVTSATDGVADAGQWWPWVCPDGANPSPASTPSAYTASGTCGPGGPFTLSVDGCDILGTWSTLGLTDVKTQQSTRNPNQGGWSITAAAPTDGGNPDGGDYWNCEAEPGAPGSLAFTCSDAMTSATTCESALAPANGS